MRALLKTALASWAPSINIIIIKKILYQTAIPNIRTNSYNNNKFI